MSEDERPTGRQLAVCYMAGLFSIAHAPITTVAVPLWALALGASPATIGLAIGSRAALSVLIAIHGGVLIDRFGARRIMFACGLVMLVCAPLTPVFPSIAAVIVLQLLLGGFQSVAWVGAQARIGRLTKGDPALVGRFTMVSTLGNFALPMLTGVFWDLAGVWGAYALLTACMAGLLAAVSLMPSAAGEGLAPAATARGAGLLPRGRDYVETFKMLGRAEIAFGVGLSVALVMSAAVRQSFYPVYLDSVGLSATMIGTLVGLGSLAASLAGLALGRMARRIKAPVLALLMLAAATLTMAVVPLTDDIVLLFVLGLAHGFTHGTGFPLVLSLMAAAVPADEQGRSVGLRITLNRSIVFVLPVVMGLVIQATDMLSGFLVGAAANLVIIALLARFWFRRVAP